MTTIPNPERGCGYLVEGGIYLTSPPFSSQGVLPAFVRFDPPIPYQGDQFRGWTPVNGLQWELANRPATTNLPDAPYRDLMANLTDGSVDLARLMTELGRHQARLELRSEATWGGDDWQSQQDFANHRTNAMAWTTDYLMWVGETYYPKPEDFIQEAISLGLSKRIPPAQVPRIVPGISKLYLVHPKAIILPAPDDGKPGGGWQPGVIGYVYLSRVAYIKPKTRKVPEKVQNWSLLGLVDIVEAGPHIPAIKRDRSQTDIIQVLAGEVGSGEGDQMDGELAEGSEDEPEDPEVDSLHDVDTMGPEVDDEGGMSEHRPGMDDPSPEGDA